MFLATSSVVEVEFVYAVFVERSYCTDVVDEDT